MCYLEIMHSHMGSQEWVSQFLCQRVPEAEKAHGLGEFSPRKLTRSQFNFLWFRESAQLSSQGNVLITKLFLFFFSSLFWEMRKVYKSKLLIKHLLCLWDRGPSTLFRWHVYCCDVFLYSKYAQNPKILLHF